MRRSKRTSWRTAAGGLVLLLLMGAAEPPQDWGDDKEEYASGPDYQPSKAMCRKVKGMAVPAAEHPSAAQAAALKGCSSEALYYGIGMAADPVKARHCAILEIDQGRDDSPFSGRTMLMTIYANGSGVKPNLDLAIHFACLMEGAPMEMQGRIEHLASIKGGQRDTAFDYCDDITSGLATGYCTAHEASIEDGKRSAKVAALSAGWTTPEKAALKTLTAAKAVWIQVVTDEVDVSGTARASFMIEAEQREEAQFLDLLTAVASGRLSGGAAQFKAADAELNRTYGLIIKSGVEEEWGTVKKADIRTVQRAWIKYRDAWVAFARIKAPGVPPEAVMAWLTRKRIESLKDFVPG